MTAMLDMSKLPAPDCIIPVDLSAELNGLLDIYTQGMRDQLDDQNFPRPLVSDPVYQVLSTVAYRLGLKRQETNEACHATMLAYATGADLEHIGATFGVAKLLITKEDNSVIPAIPAVWEDDSRFRLRIQMALESWTTAGSRGSYEYAILTASPYVLDVFIDRPSFDRKTWQSLGLKDRAGLFILGTTHDARLQNPIPGHVAITLLIDDTANTDAVKTAVNTALDVDQIIPMTDVPEILESDVITYEIVATLYFYPGPSPEPSLLAAETALKAYTTDNFKLGHDIAESGLHQAAHQAEVQRVELNLDGDITVHSWQAAKCSNITVQLGGRDV